MEDPDRRDRLRLSEDQKRRVREITLGVELVDQTVRDMAADDVLATLENGHPLNRVIADQRGETIGYVACEDFVPSEAYVKYFATSGGAGRDLFREIPAFLEYAKARGYLRVNFHGWNQRLNRVLERYGFTRLRTDRMGELAAEFYEKDLAPAKSGERVDAERRAAFERKYLLRLRRDYENILVTFSATPKEGETSSPRAQKTNAIEATYRILARELSGRDGLIFGERQQAVLKLKLARHLQQNDGVDTNVLVDALMESPKFLESDKGSVHRILEIHEEKTVMKIAEIRRRLAERTGDEGQNPYEILFTTVSGNYYLARLLNMPHLEQESAYMNHCVGTSDSYVNQMRRGEIEIFSLRSTSNDMPVMTIEYEPKTGAIVQMKKADEEYLRKEDPYYEDVMDALRSLPETETDVGRKRRVARISASELEDLQLPEPADAYVLTVNGEVSVANFVPERDGAVLKLGRFELDDGTPKEDIAKLLNVFQGTDWKPGEIARTMAEISPATRLFAGRIENTSDFFQLLPDTVTDVYTSVERESSIRRERLEIGGMDKGELRALLGAQGHRLSGPAESKFDSVEFTTLKNRERINLIRLTVGDLGFPEEATTDDIFTRAEFLGLELCPTEVGPYYCLQYTDQTPGQWVQIGIRSNTDTDRHPEMWQIPRFGGGHPWLYGLRSSPGIRWDADSEFVFRLRKKSS